MEDVEAEVGEAAFTQARRPRNLDEPEGQQGDWLELGVDCSEVVGQGSDRGLTEERVFHVVVVAQRELGDRAGRGRAVRLEHRASDD